MAEFPDIVDTPLRERLAALRVKPGDVEERFIRGSGAGGQKIKKFKTISTVFPFIKDPPSEQEY